MKKSLLSILREVEVIFILKSPSQVRKAKGLQHIVASVPDLGPLPYTELMIILKKSLQLLGKTLVPPLSLDTPLANQLAGLTLFRWVSSLAQLGIIISAFELDFIGQDVLGIGLVLVLLQTLLNPFYIWTLRVIPHKVNAGMLTAILALDYVIISTLLAMTQGIHNPFFPLIYIYALLAALILPPVFSGLFVLLMLCAFYLLNPVVYVFDAYGTYVRLSALHTLGVQSTVLISIWGVTTGLNQRIQKDKIRLQKVKERAERLKKVKLIEALGAGFSHEFATPLNTIKLRLESLQNTIQNEKNNDLEVAQEALKQCENALTGMARFSQHSQTQLQSVDFKAFLERLIQKWETQHPKAPTITFQTNIREPQALEISPKLFELSMFNLLDNAYLSGSPDINCKLTYRSNAFVLSICDTGQGWPESVKTHLGEPFISTRSQGTGLGLYTVYVMVETLGGHIALKDNHPQGARVEICIPQNL